MVIETLLLLILRQLLVTAGAWQCFPCFKNGFRFPSRGVGRYGSRSTPVTARTRHPRAASSSSPGSPATSPASTGNSRTTWTTRTTPTTSPTWGTASAWGGRAATVALTGLSAPRIRSEIYLKLDIQRSLQCTAWLSQDAAGYFSLSGPLPTSTTGSAVTVSTNDVDIGDSECRQDYVTIPGGWGGTDINNALYDRDRFCGQALGYCLEDTCNTRAVGAVRWGLEFLWTHIKRNVCNLDPFAPHSCLVLSLTMMKACPRPLPPPQAQTLWTGDSDCSTGRTPAPKKGYTLMHPYLVTVFVFLFLYYAFIYCQLMTNTTRMLAIVC